MSIADPPLAAELIRRKRDGAVLDAAALRAVAEGIGTGTWSEGQVAAFAMAVAWRGMRDAECTAFTLALRDSGDCLRWDDLPGPVLDKHSTGGVGDCVSLALAPLVAACGGFVPMLSGRGLGHTGGTLDKLESIRGYDVDPEPARLRRVVREAGCAIVGQSASLVPADRRLYAIRDVTATGDVPELMVASIRSKKLAGGAAALVLDVKTGNGAQLASPGQAAQLARRLLQVAQGAGVATRVVLSDMGQVLGRSAGNALELRDAVDLLCGRSVCPRLRELTIAQAAALLCLGRLADDTADARRRLEQAIASGAAAERFGRMVAGLGGPADLVEKLDLHLPLAPVRRPVPALRDGVVRTLDVRALGMAVVALGGGRTRPGGAIDHAVGLDAVLGRGARVRAGDTLAVVHARSERSAEQAVAAVQAAIAIGEGAPEFPPLLEWFELQAVAA